MLAPREWNPLPARPKSAKKKRKGVRSIGAKRKREAPGYRKAVREHLAEFPNCQIGPIIRAAGFSVRCNVIAKCVHHTRRRGRFLCDRSTFLSACDGECHIPWVHTTHVKQAYELGLLVR